MESKNTDKGGVTAHLTDDAQMEGKKLTLTEGLFRTRAHIAFF